MSDKVSNVNDDIFKRSYYGSLVILFIVFIIFLFKSSTHSLPVLYAGEQNDISEDKVSDSLSVNSYISTGSETVVAEIDHQKNIINDLTVIEKLVNINNAPAEELCTLNGIGIKTAEAIIKYREVNGSFKCKEDLMKVKGIGEKKYSAVVDKIVL